MCVLIYSAQHKQHKQHTTQHTSRRSMGDKALAKATMADAGVPVVPGYYGSDQSDERCV